MVRNLNKVIEKKETFGDRLSDGIAAYMGSWRFIILQSIVVIAWVTVNLLAIVHFLHFDPYPFILLNLVFSTQAAYAAPIIMMSQNRQAAKDRIEAELDFEVNRKAENEIGEINKKLDILLSQQVENI